MFFCFINHISIFVVSVGKLLLIVEYSIVHHESIILNGLFPMRLQATGTAINCNRGPSCRIERLGPVQSNEEMFKLIIKEINSLIEKYHLEFIQRVIVTRRFRDFSFGPILKIVHIDEYINPLTGIAFFFFFFSFPTYWFWLEPQLE